MSTKQTIIFIIVIAITSFIAMSLVQYVQGQEVSSEDASKNAKEILCKEYYALKYCEGQGQEVNNNTNSTIKQKQEVNNNTNSKPELDCFSLGDIFDPYYGHTRCLLK